MRALLFAALAGAASCAVPDGESAKLYYFDARGLGQAVRLMLTDIGLPFTEERYNKDTWANVKQEGIDSGLFPFGQVPVLEHFAADGTRTLIAQSNAILMFLARKYDYYGSNLEQQTAIDMMAGGVGDLRRRYGQFVYHKDAASDAELLESYTRDIDTWTTYYDHLLAPHEGKWTGGSEKVTWADFLLFDLIDTCVLRVHADALATHPHLIMHYHNMLDRPGVTAYMHSPKNHHYANGPSASFDTHAHVPPHLEEEMAQRLNTDEDEFPIPEL